MLWNGNEVFLNTSAEIMVVFKHRAGFITFTAVVLLPANFKRNKKDKLTPYLPKIFSAPHLAWKKSTKSLFLQKFIATLL